MNWVFGSDGAYRRTITAKWYERQTEAMQEKLKTVTL
jgi:hypothetical protein